MLIDYFYRCTLMPRFILFDWMLQDFWVKLTLLCRYGLLLYLSSDVYATLVCPCSLFFLSSSNLPYTFSSYFILKYNFNIIESGTIIILLQNLVPWKVYCFELFLFYGAIYYKVRIVNLLFDDFLSAASTLFS